MELIMRVSTARECKFGCHTDIYLKNDGSGWKAYECDNDQLHICKGKRNSDFVTSDKLSDEIIRLNNKEQEKTTRIRYDI